MKEFLDYFSVGLPLYVLYSSFGLTIVVIIVASRLFRNKRRVVLSALLVEYIYIVVCSTIIFRRINTYKFERIQLTPFWTYRAVMTHTIGVSFWDIVLNVVLFMPLGFLVKLLYPSISSFKMLLVALGCSICIEINQYIFEKGVTQIDDVIHNVIGALMGWIMALIVIKLPIKKWPRILEKM